MDATIDRCAGNLLCLIVQKRALAGRDKVEAEVSRVTCTGITSGPRVVGPRRDAGATFCESVQSVGGNSGSGAESFISTGTDMAGKVPSSVATQ